MGPKMKVSKAVLGSQMDNFIGKSKELQDKHVYRNVLNAVGCRTEDSQS